MKPFEGKVAIATGGGAGIGEALSEEPASRGSKVIVANIGDGRADHVAAAITQKGGQARAVHADVSKDGDVKRLVDGALSEYGQLDYVRQRGHCHRRRGSRPDPGAVAPHARRGLQRSPPWNSGGLFSDGEAGLRAHREHLIGRRLDASTAQRPIFYRQARNRRVVSLVASGRGGLGSEGGRRVPRIRAHEHLSERGQGQRLKGTGNRAAVAAKDGRSLRSGEVDSGRGCAQPLNHRISCSDSMDWALGSSLPRYFGRGHAGSRAKV